ncbi:DNA topoisomerase IB [Streptoalloteichus tenebrarius]|uniref:DNA topoisomerase n=1 Tax=Streptoalloteichus tenebrarius (strain ATCC 17920 / DSM 40477 / JCM 4838 / CBS 697.72 / NBRC 16177 / NCIMB 11028 / NRRL B-12390 / A12253. 1 / ISP 5477) TaxID=1933 RepID=A0ABT1HRA2_STRSD|nr:DNA topoisomerase IB [Streptoalloteichus tenebrarius]MCP2258043.1 DNA topoisomerase IB [Streptoalloteichus tenebrarius]
MTEPETLERVAHLAIPPAWRDVWICPDAQGHIQATGTDDAGRRQYLYHEDWVTKRDAEKFERVLALGARMPRVRARVAELVAGRGLGRERVLAAALRMLELGIFRVGGHEYAQEHGSYGLSTLLREHVEVHRGRIHIAYTAKGGIERRTVLDDADLLVVVRALLRRRDPNPELLGYWNQGWHNVRAEDINDFLRELAGDGFTAKDVRTWNATVLAAVALAVEERPESRRGRRRAVANALSDVAEELGNTPAVCRKSYVDPRVLEAYERGLTIRPAVLRIGSTELTRPEVRDSLERAVLRLLRGRR